MASRGDTQSLRLIEFSDSTTDLVAPGNFTLSANSGSLYFNGTQVNTGSNNFAVMSSDLIVPYNNSSSVTIGSNLVLRQSTTTHYQAGQGFQYLSDGRLFFEGVEFGGRTNLLPVVTSNIVTSQREYLSINANVSILNTVNVTTANVFLRSNVVFSMSDPEIQFDSGALSIRPLTSAGVLKIYGSSNKANVWLVSNDSTNGDGTDVANFSFVSTGDNTTSTNKHAIAKISVNQTEALSASSGGGILSLTTRDPTKAAATDQGDSDRQLTMLSCNTSTSGNIIALGPGGDLDNVYVGIGLVRPTNKFQVYSGGKTFFAVDTVGSKISIGSSTALDFAGPITISGQSADRLMIGTTGAGQYATSVGVSAGAAGQSATALGYEAGKTAQGSFATSIGFGAGLTSQSANATAIGPEAGTYLQGVAATAIGSGAGYGNQGTFALAVGDFSGLENQGAYSIAIGAASGQRSQGSSSVAIGFQAGQSNQRSQSLAMGYQAGQTSQAVNSMAIGYQAGKTSQGSSAMAFGTLAGESSQGADSMALGTSAGQTSQGVRSVAIGSEAGKTSQSSDSTAIGYFAGQVSQGSSSIAIGTSAGQSTQGSQSLALGFQAGQSTQGSSSISIGESAGNYLQGQGTVAIGKASGKNNQGSFSIAIGLGAAVNAQATSAIAIGYLAGSNVQGSGSVAIGTNAGFASQSPQALAIGVSAGESLQSYLALALGFQAGQFNQSPETIAIGSGSGNSNQGSQAIAIGSNAGSTGQDIGSIAVGYRAGRTGQGPYSIAIGYNTGATNQIPDKTIFLNATGGSFVPYVSSSFNVRPVRLSTDTPTGNVLSYNYGTGEIYQQGLIFTGSSGVGISNGAPGDHLLAIGTRTYFEESATSNAMVTVGNVSALGYFGYGGELSNITGITAPDTYGSGSTVPVITVDSLGRITGITNTSITYGGTLQQVVDAGNTTNKLINFSNTGIALITDGSVGVSNVNVSTSYAMSIGDKTFFSNSLASNTIVTTGNIAANYLFGDLTYAKYPTSLGVGTYGTSTLVPQIQVDSFGRIVNIVEIGVIANVSLGQAMSVGNSVSTAISFTGGTALMTAPNSNVGIGNTNPLNLLSIGANTFFTEFGSNTLVTRGNVSANVGYFRSIITSSNVGIGNTLPSNLLCIGTKTRFNDTGSNVGMITDGNVTAIDYYGSARFLSNVAGATTAATYGSGTAMPQIVIDASGRITSIVSTAVSATLAQVAGYGNTTSNTIQFTNAGNSLITTGQVGIGNANPSNLLCIGAKTRFNDTGSNVGMITDGNVTAIDYYGSARFLSNVAGATTAATYGSGTAMPQIVVDASGRITSIVSTAVSATLDQVAGYGNTTSNTIQFTNTGTSLVTSGRVGIANANPSNILCIGIRTRFNDDGSNVGMITDGNVTAIDYYGSARFLSNIAGATTPATYGSGIAMPQIVVDSSGRITSIVSTQVAATLAQVASYGNTTSNTIQFTNAATSLITSGRVGISNSNPSNLLSIGIMTRFNDSGSNTGMITDGNVTAVNYYGSALFLSNVAGSTTAATYGSGTAMPQIVVDTSGRITSIVSTAVSATLNQVAGYGNTTSNTIQFTNATNSLVTSGRVGISNANPSNLLSIGIMSRFNDSGSNTGLVTDGNVTAVNYYGSARFLSNVAGATTAATYGSVTTVPRIVVDTSGRITSIVSADVSVTLDQVAGYGNTTSNTIQFTNAGNSLITSGRVGINNTNPSNLLSIGLMTRFNDSGSNTGMITNGNVTATNYYGSALFLSNTAGVSESGTYGSSTVSPTIIVDSSGRITSISANPIILTLDQIVNFGNSTSNTVLFTNSGNSLLAYGNVGIGTSATASNTLTVGSNLWVRDTGSNVLFVNGNIFTTSLKTSGNVGIGNVVPSNLLCIGSSTYFTDNSASNVMVTVGNVFVNYYYGNAWNMKNTTRAVPATYGSGTTVPQIIIDSDGRISSITSIALGEGGQTLDQAVGTGNTTSNTILLQSTSNGLVASGNIVAANFRLTTSSVQLGLEAGTVGQNVSSVSIGTRAGQSGQYANAVSIGVHAGQFNQETGAVALGELAGQSGQNVYAIAIGSEAGRSGQFDYAIAIGDSAGGSAQGTGTVAIGQSAALISQGSRAVAIGYFTGQATQGSFAVSIGNVAGQTSQGVSAVAIGPSSGVSNQGSSAVSIGDAAGFDTQGITATAVGNRAGRNSQGSSAVAIGHFAGNSLQVSNAIAIGSFAGQTSQATVSVAIGDLAGQLSQNTSSVAIGQIAGQLQQGSGSVAIGGGAGTSAQQTFAVAIGASAGRSYQNTNAIAIGQDAGRSWQAGDAIAIGQDAGRSYQNTYSIAIGYQAGECYQSSHAIAIGENAGDNAQNLYSVAIGFYAGKEGQGYAGIGIGGQAGRYGQASWGVSIGDVAGQSFQGVSAVAIAASAGQLSQNGYAIAIGSAAGQSFQNSFAVAVGYNAGKIRQRESAVAIGPNAGVTSQGSYGVAIGNFAGQNTQGSSAVAIGDVSGQTQGAESVAVGVSAGGNQGVASVAVGSSAGGNQINHAIAIGTRAGFYQFSNAIAIGRSAGDTPGAGSQGIDAIAIGTLAGYGSSIQQNTNAIAIGFAAGYDFQNIHAIAIGTFAGRASQNTGSVAIGVLAGASGQGLQSVALGAFAGQSSQGSYSVCIGPRAGIAGCGAGSIIINGGSVALSNTTADACYIKPVRSGATSTGNLAGYNPTSDELFYTGISQNSAGDLVVPSGKDMWGTISGSNTIGCSTLTSTTYVDAVKVSASTGFYGDILGSNTIDCSTVTATSYVAGSYFTGVVVSSTATTYTINSGALASVYLFTPASTLTITLANLPATGDGVVIHIRCTNGTEFRLAPASGVSLVQTNNNIISFPSYEGYPSARNAMLAYQDSTSSWYVLNYI
jgi:hypothetical protein